MNTTAKKPDNYQALDIKIKKIHTNAELPAYGSIESAGADLYACIEEDIVLKPGKRVVVPHGFSMELPLGFEAQIRSRSGLAFKNGIIVLNSPGTVDSDFRGELKTLLIHLGEEDFVIKNGMRISQMVISRHATANWVETSVLCDTNRGSGGYGSTGI
ncbi:MAG TPA: dUTP diphosphatase [Holosporales bacterium]|nr:dUTP diphosphatase [Holosporales bacterium]